MAASAAQIVQVERRVFTARLQLAVQEQVIDHPDAGAVQEHQCAKVTRKL